MTDVHTNMQREPHVRMLHWQGNASWATTQQPAVQRCDTAIAPTQAIKSYLKAYRPYFEISHDK